MLANVADAMRVIAILIKPFLPQTAETFYRAFNFESGQPWDEVSYGDAATPFSGGSLRVTAPMVERQAGPAVPQDRHPVNQASSSCRRPRFVSLAFPDFQR